ncbi:hypothetical protein MKW98_029726 [Papaver atlanticum]|uniref:Aldehyde dehydrogenase domain-containing protein n=1 Tax=Papaver atlanticum TaxID=357466 RepID=A0AAD4T4H0_9MAGN|nr:hypothetical protein MKW98_029726 [Papaver atlanticum]
MKNRDEKKDGNFNLGRSSMSNNVMPNQVNVLGWADKIPVFKFKLMSIPHMQTVHEPTGVGGQIFPWNFPLHKFVRKLIMKIVLLYQNNAVAKKCLDSTSSMFRSQENHKAQIKEDCKSSGVAYIYWSASEGVDKGDLKFSRCGCFFVVSDNKLCCNENNEISLPEILNTGGP